jgi:hypothetical protein
MSGLRESLAEYLAVRRALGLARRIEEVHREPVCGLSSR